MTDIITIGYGDRTIEEVFALLSNHEVSILVDIRSHPFSSYKPEFSRDPLSRFCERYKIRYEYQGHLLGGQPDDETCYRAGKVNYEVCRQKPFFREGIEKVKQLVGMGKRVALICSERKPTECHRVKLVGSALTEEGCMVGHIDELGHLRPHHEVLEMIANLKTQMDLFGSTELDFSRKKYRK